MCVCVNPKGKDIKRTSKASAPGLRFQSNNPFLKDLNCVMCSGTLKQQPQRYPLHGVRKYLVHHLILAYLLNPQAAYLEQHDS